MQLQKGDRFVRFNVADEEGDFDFVGMTNTGLHFLQVCSSSRSRRSRVIVRFSKFVTLLAWYLLPVYR